MKRYEEYKDSGVQWLGKVPSHWNPCRFKNFVSLINSPSADENKIGLENIESGTGRFIETDSEFEGNGVQYVENDIVYGKLRPYLKKVWLATNKGNAVGDFFVFRAKKSSSSYSKWLMLSDGFTSEANGSTFGAKMPRVSSDFILSMHYALPPLSEQQLIASFLDAKTKPIDNIISKREKQIELLEEMKSAIISCAVTKGLNSNVKMKNSGIDWIGEIPEGWSIIRLKHLASLYGRIGYRGYTQQDIVPQGEGAITISPSNMVKGHMDFKKCTYLSWAKYNESPEIMIQNNDILLVKTGSTYGKVAIVNDIPIEATINPQIVAIKNIKCNPDLLNYILGTPYVHLQVESTVIGSTIPTISQEKINNYVLAMPPAGEQRAIASYLATETSKLDARIAKRRRQIELLHEYKQALITNAVTGKIDVRGFNS